MIMTANYIVHRLPRRGKVEAWPGVDGHAWVDLGSDLYMIEQSGMADLRSTTGGINSGALAMLHFEDRPGVFDGSDLVTVDTQGQGVYDNCRLESIDITRVSTNIVNYSYKWRQMSPGHSLSWPY